MPDKGFQQVRYYGFYANKYKDKIIVRKLFNEKQLNRMKHDTIWTNGLMKAFGYNPTLCKCWTQMLLNYELSSFNNRGYG